MDAKQESLLRSLQGRAYVFACGDSPKTFMPQVTIRFHGTIEEQRTACCEMVAALAACEVHLDVGK